MNQGSCHLERISWPQMVAGSQLCHPARHIAGHVCQHQVWKIDQQRLIFAGHTRPVYSPGPYGELDHHHRRDGGRLTPGLDAGQQFPGQWLVPGMSFQVIDEDGRTQANNAMAC
jgi:hypothetical protein